MKNLEIPKEMLSLICEKKQPVFTNKTGIYFNLGEDTLFKFRYTDFIDCFEHDSNGAVLTRLGDISSRLEELKDNAQVINEGKGNLNDYYLTKAASRKAKITRTKLPIGFVKIDGVNVGHILPKHKDMISLSKALNENKITYNDVPVIIENLQIAIAELMNSYIYPMEINTHTVLINPHTLEIQLTNLEQNITVMNGRNDRFKRHALQQLSRLRDMLYYYTDKQIPEQETDR
jgi:hypothetical protein